MRVVDLFCGAGGLSEGFRQAGFGVVAGAELDPDALATFRVNFPEAEAIAGDIRDPAVKARVLAAARRSDVVVGGPPCQGFSQVRNHSRLIDDPRNALYREFVDVVRHASPPAFVMENVPGMDQMGVKAQVLEDLSVDGRYRVSRQFWTRLTSVCHRRGSGSSSLACGTIWALLHPPWPEAGLARG